MSDSLNNAEMLQYIFENAKVGIAICDAKEHRLKAVNPAFARIHGYEIDELIGEMPEKVFSLECMTRLAEHETNFAMCPLHDVSFETTHLKKDGSFIEVSVHITVIKDEKRNVKQRIANVVDISQKKQQAKLLEDKEKEFHSLTENIPDSIARWDKDGNYLYINPSLEQTLGVKVQEVLGKSIKDLFPKYTELIGAIAKIQRLESDSVVVRQNAIVNGVKNVHEVKFIGEKNEQGELVTILGIGRNITQIMTTQEQLKEAVEIRRGIINSIPDLLFEVDRCGNYLNFWFHDKELMDSYRKRLFGKNIKDILPLEATITAFEAIEEANTNKISLGKIYSIEEHDTLKWFELSISKKSDGNFLALAHDVTERKNIEKRIEFMAHHDMLTGLPNRLLLNDRAKQIVAKSKRDGQKAAVLFIDLDGFKTINDSLGHSIGDLVLKEVATRLQSCTRASDTLSRQGGDEFILVSPEIQSLQEVEVIAQKLIQVFKKSFVINNQTLSTSASIGITLYPEHGDTFEQLLQNADAAMYKAKETGKNTYCFFTKAMKHNMLGQFQLQNDLKKALKNKEFILHYQPQIDLSENKIIGVEALIRWEHPTMGMIPPMSFISIAESCGYIVEIGEWVLHEACRQTALWNNQGKDIVVAVNISAVQFKRGNLLKIIKKALEISGLNPKYLELELTESILISDTENVLELVKEIKEMGVQLSIDDFGTGYSSLSYLKRFAVDKLKIDQSFVRDILNDKEDATIVKTIIAMAKNFNLKSIAEGVENQEVLELVKEFGCDEVQGYHFAKPMAVEEFNNYYENKFC